MFGLLILAILAADPVVQDDKTTVVVTARTLKSTEADLLECLARNCPPREDIEASLAHGENLFIAGNYDEARKVLRKAKGRNGTHAAALPVEVSDLNRAYGRIAAFNGYSANARLAQIESLEALKSGLDRNDARVLMQRLMLADEYLRAGQLIYADEVFSTVEKQAVAAGLPRVRGLTMLRRAAVYMTIASVRPEFRPSARHHMKRLLQTTDQELAPFREAAKMLTAQDAADRKDQQAFETILASIDATQETSPQLIYAPAIDLPSNDRARSIVDIDRGDAAPQFIDIGFDIGLDGRVADIVILRKTDTVAGTWPELVLKAIAGRRYLPIGPKVDRATLQRTERYSMVYNVATLTGSRMPSRSPRGRIVSLDLTVAPKKLETNAANSRAPVSAE